MSFYISLIGIDGSGKSTLVPTLANLAAAELGLTAIAVGGDFWGQTPQENLFSPGFKSTKTLFSSQLGGLFHQGAKAATANRRLYPCLKLAQLACQEATINRLAQHHRPDIIFSDSNLLLSSAGRAINYTQTKTGQPGLQHPNHYLAALYDYVFTPKPHFNHLPQSLPGLKFMRWLRQLDQHFKGHLLRLPDAIIFLDITPEAALARLLVKNEILDSHENLYDLTQARTMYQAVVQFFCQQRGAQQAISLDVTQQSIGQTLREIVKALHDLPIAKHGSQITKGTLGGTDKSLVKTTAILKKALHHNYLLRHLLPNLHRNSASELTFPFSPLGQLLFREGYSANLMRAIYTQKEQTQPWLNRIFLNYPLHRAIYNRLKILHHLLEKEFVQRLSLSQFRSPEQKLKVLTAPSGYVLDLFQPLYRLANAKWLNIQAVHIVASDLNPAGNLAADLSQMAQLLGLDFNFIPGDMTSNAIAETFKQGGPYDIVLFVGFSTWIPKFHLIRHLKLIYHHLLKPGGVLITDCFSPQAFARSGKHFGYQANYYSPQEFANLLAYCGFEEPYIRWESEPETIIHIFTTRVARPKAESETIRQPLTVVHQEKKPGF